MAHKEPPEGYVNIPTAAKMAGVAPQTMYRIVAIEGRIPSETAPGGTRTYYYMKKQAVEKFLETYRKPLRGRPKTRASLYEIVIISCGKREVLYSTDSPVELSHMYITLQPLPPKDQEDHRMRWPLMQPRPVTSPDKCRVAYRKEVRGWKLR